MEQVFITEKEATGIQTPSSPAQLLHGLSLTLK